jgi:hypothetical protein
LNINCTAALISVLWRLAALNVTVLVFPQSSWPFQTRWGDQNHLRQVVRVFTALMRTSP